MNILTPENMLLFLLTLQLNLECLNFFFRFGMSQCYLTLGNFSLKNPKGYISEEIHTKMKVAEIDYLD